MRAILGKNLKEPPTRRLIRRRLSDAFYQPASCWLRIYLSLSLLRGSVCVCVWARQFFARRAEKWIRCLKGDEEIILQIASIWLFLSACVCVWMWMARLFLFAGPQMTRKKLLVDLCLVWEKVYTHSRRVLCFLMYTFERHKKSDGDKKVMIIILFWGPVFVGT
jgi:hypothetical protein